MNAYDFPVGSHERLMLLAPPRIVARNDQRDTICGGENLLNLSGPGTIAATPGWKPQILKQTNNPQTITFFLPTLVNGTTGGGDEFEVGFVIRGIDSRGQWVEESFYKVCESKLGTSAPEGFSCYTTETMWHWVLEVEMTHYVTTGSTINGFYLGHAIGGETISLFYDHGGTTYDIGRNRIIDRLVSVNRESDTVTTVDPATWDYNPESGRLHYQIAGVYDESQGLYVIAHPRAGR